MKNGLGKRVKVKLGTSVMDGGRPYETGDMEVTMYEEGAISIHDLDGCDTGIYLYKEQVERLLMALGLRNGLEYREGD